MGTLARDGLSAAHQCHDVVGQVSSQVGGHETREAGEGDASVILVGAAQILGEEIIKVGEREKKKGCQGDESLEQKRRGGKNDLPFGSDWLSA